MQNAEIIYQDFGNISPKPKDFVYIDPPYQPINHTSFTKYTKLDFTEADQIKLYEKYPYLVLNIKEQGIYDTIIIIDGNGYKKETLKWLKAQVGSNLIEVFSMSEFTSWVNKKKI